MIILLSNAQLISEQYIVRLALVVFICLRPLINGNNPATLFNDVHCSLYRKIRRTNLPINKKEFPSVSRGMRFWSEQLYVAFISRNDHVHG